MYVFMCYLIFKRVVITLSSLGLLYLAMCIDHLAMAAYFDPPHSFNSCTVSVDGSVHSFGKCIVPIYMCQALFQTLATQNWTKQNPTLMKKTLDYINITYERSSGAELRGHYTLS
jgi:hypothetical protein